MNFSTQQALLVNLVHAQGCGKTACPCLDAKLLLLHLSACGGCPLCSEPRLIWAHFLLCQGPECALCQQGRRMQQEGEGVKLLVGMRLRHLG